jgi:BMFP domain-containing protein YqiC
LSKLDVVSRAEFDAQAAVLQRTRAKVDELEQALAALSAELDKADDN